MWWDSEALPPTKLPFSPLSRYPQKTRGRSSSEIPPPVELQSNWVKCSPPSRSTSFSSNRADLSTRRPSSTVPPIPLALPIQLRPRLPLAARTSPRKRRILQAPSDPIPPSKLPIWVGKTPTARFLSLPSNRCPTKSKEPSSWGIRR